MIDNQFPGYMYIQSHPSVNAFDKVQQLNGILENVNAELEIAESPKLTEDTLIAIGRCKSGDAVPKDQEENYCIVNYFKSKIQMLLIDLPQDGASYSTCLQYVEKNILNTKLTSNTIVNIIKQINKILFPEDGGNYRTATVIIYNDLIMPKVKSKTSFVKLDEFFKNEDKDIFSIWAAQTRKKVWDREFAKTRTITPFDEKDVKCLVKIADIVSPKAIEPGIKELKIALTSTDDCYELAGRLHQILIKAHPFNDGNGRTARIIMNVVLIQAGKMPLLLDSDDNYTLAVKGNDFVAYIRQLADKQPACEKVVSIALRQMSAVVTK